MTLEKLANPPVTEGDVYKYYGNQLLHGVLAGGVYGAGGMGIWHFLKKVKNEREQEKKKQLSIGGIASSTPDFVAPKIASDFTNVMALPLSGAGAGALIGALGAEKGKKWRAAATGAALGGGAGLATSALSPGFSESVGRSFPKSISDLVPFKRLFPHEKYTAPTSTYRAFAYLAPIVGGAAGAYGGGQAVNALMKDDKSHEQKNHVQSSRDEYFKTLLNEDENADDKKDKEKTAFSAALDAHYAAYEKAAEGGGIYDRIAGGLQSAAHYLSPPNKAEYGPFDGGGLENTWRELGAWPQIIAGASALGGGAIGAKYMYDKTKATSQAKLLNAARQARERMRGLDTPWVDPVELASIKEISRKNEPTHVRGQ